MISTTGTTIENYLAWLRDELANKQYGEVSLMFKVCRGQIVGVEKASKDTEVIGLQKSKR